MSLERVFCLVVALLMATTASFASGPPDSPPDARAAGRVDWSLGELEKTLGKYQHRKVGFRETHVSGLLDEPLTLKGTLTFTAPARLEKHVTSPYEERYLVDGDEVSFESPAAGISHRLSLENFPSLRGFVDGLRAAFTGNLSILQSFFHISLDGDRQAWQLNLEPIHGITQSAIDSIQITGEYDALTSIEIRETSGDYSRIEITPNSG